MGLTNRAVGRGAVDGKLEICRQSDRDLVIAIAGNPNVGKSTVFNGLTGMHQHTGNWPGKTVANAQGRCSGHRHDYILVDIPGTYSLMAHSPEEEVARDFLCFGGADAAVVVCDATCLERNLNLVLQTLELMPRVVVCVNLLDEAKRKQIHVDLEALSQLLGVPVVGTVARKKRSIRRLVARLDDLVEGTEAGVPRRVQYPKGIEAASAVLEPVLEGWLQGRLPARWLSLRLLEGDAALLAQLKVYLGAELMEVPEVARALERAENILAEHGIGAEQVKDRIVSGLVLTAEGICNTVVHLGAQNYDVVDRRIDRILTSRWAGYPVMLVLLAFIFWLTITGANYPSQLLATVLFRLQEPLRHLLVVLGTPGWIQSALVDGVYLVLAWVISVMLPPMAIFFPLFTLLEDVGYLPRIAYNLDQPFQRCSACGKQALTMAMGLGCNAAGVVGCRIIDSPRERLLAILTNSFVPCNGRFPGMIAILTIFFVGAGDGFLGNIQSALLLTLTILLGVGATFLATWLLSRTVLRGLPSSFTLELPPYRRPQLGQVIFRSILDRTVFVLGRAAAVAAPAGLLIWVMANVQVGGMSLLSHCAAFLDPFARQLGLDGVILFAFILGMPANEIVIPIILMAYTAQGSLQEMGNLLELGKILAAHGWTWVTGASVVVFSLLHWPCTTTLLTIRKETGSWKWTALGFLLPAGMGILLCFLLSHFAVWLGY